MDDNTIRFTGSQKEFIESSETIVAHVGMQGEGKTFAGIWAAAIHAELFDRTMNAVLIRDTLENIKRMTRPSILKATNNEAVFSDGCKKLRWANTDWDLFGIDDYGGLSKLQGAEPDLVWIEEPAAIIDRGNAGVPEWVFDVALSRVGRQADSVPRFQITMNPADEDHWTYRRLIENPQNGEFVTTRVVHCQYGENVDGLSQEQRERVKIAYKDKPDLYARYVEGRFSFVAVGESVTPEYNEDLYRSKETIHPDQKFDTIRLWDGGLNPTCIFLQITPRGRLVVTDTIRGENIGVRQLITTIIRPLINKNYAGVESWRDIGDPSMTNREQSDSSATAAKVIEQELGGHFEKGDMNWDLRREALRELMNRNVDGMPMFQISHHEGILHRSLRGGWHYKVDNNGKVLRDKPVKDIHSHPGDALSHGIGKILGRPDIDDRVLEAEIALEDQMESMRVKNMGYKRYPQRQRMTL